MVGVSGFTADLRVIFGVDSALFMSETRVLMIFRDCFLSFSPLSGRSAGSVLATMAGLLSKEIGDVGLGLEIGSELERMFENDITPEARLGVYDVLALNRQREKKQKKAITCLSCCRATSSSRLNIFAD